MSPEARRGWVLFGGYAAVVLFQVPLAFLAEKATGAVGGLLILVPLFAGMLVEEVARSGTASEHMGLVWSVSFAMYAAAFSALALPLHFAFRERIRAHAIAMALVALGFALLVAFAFPVRGMPI